MARGTEAEKKQPAATATTCLSKTVERARESEREREWNHQKTRPLKEVYPSSSRPGYRREKLLPRCIHFPLAPCASAGDVTALDVFPRSLVTLSSLCLSLSARERVHAHRRQRRSDACSRIHSFSGKLISGLSLPSPFLCAYIRARSGLRL